MNTQPPHVIEWSVAIGPEDVTWPQYLSNEDDEYAAASIECDGDAEDGDNPSPPAHSLLADTGVGIPHLPG